jgi:NAD(P)-dependent dehydrogenase (short-subunit alcohol dehydrogenase family)
VFDTKVLPAATIAHRLATLHGGNGQAPSTLVLFGSIAGVFGNRGQADYGAANDALDALAWALHGHESVRVLSVDWGPWGADATGSGMVTEELAREYARRGLGLLDTDDAVGHLLGALAAMAGDRTANASGDHPHPPQLLVMAGSPDGLASTAPTTPGGSGVNHPGA